MLSIFVSHSRHDQKAADDIAVAVERVGFQSLFLDFDPDTGTGATADWEKTLHEKLAGCRAVILALTPSWFASPWCRVALAQARALGKAVLPVACAPLGERVLPEFEAAELIEWGAGPARLEERLRALAQELAQGFKLEATRPPYPGLRAFEAADAAVYFGRDAEIRALIERLESCRVQGGRRLLLVTGPSGAGKSSFLKAGVLPQLARRPRDWLQLAPVRPQQVPETFGKALAEEAGGATVLPIDQFEEIVTVASASERSAVLAALVSALTRDRPVMVLAAGRSDLVAGLLEASELAPFAETWLLPPMPLDRISRLIEGPAAVAGIEVESGLSEAIGRDLQSPPALPLLAHTLRLLHERASEPNKLGLGDYYSLGDPALALNPIANAVRRTADQALRALDPSAAELKALRDAFVSHLACANRGRPMRRPARLAELPADALRLVRTLSDARLLTARADEEDSIEVAHAALFEAWPLLAQWLAEDDAFLSDLARIRRAHAAWSEAPEDRKAPALLGGFLLARSRDWLTQYPQRFGDADMAALKAFITTSAAKEDAEKARVAAQEARTRRTERRTVVAALVFALFCLGISVYAGWQDLLARQDQVAAQQAEAAAQQSELVAGQAALAARQAQTEATAARDRAQAREARAIEGEARALTERRQSLAAVAANEERRGNLDSALRLGVLAARGIRGERDAAAEASARTALSAALLQADWSLVLSGHEDQVASAAFSPDGKRIVTASADNTAGIWDAATGEEITVLRGHSDYVNSASFSPDGARIVTASADKTARIFDAATGKELAVLRGHDNWVISAAFSGDSKRIVTASADNTARIWDAATGKELTVLRGHDGYVMAAAFSPDGRRIVTASADKTARVWDAGSGRSTDILRGHLDSVWSAAFSPDGTRIVTASADTTARVWNAVTGRELMQLRGHEDRVQSAAFSADGKRIVTASNDKTARIFDAATGKELAVLRGHESSVRSAAFSPDGKRIVTASNDKTARVREATTGEIAVLRGHEGSVNFAAWSADGSRIVTASDDDTARIWGTATGKAIAMLHRAEDAVRSAEFSPDGKRVVIASRDTTARIFDVATGSELLVLRGHEGAVNFAAFSPDGARVVTASDDGTARIFDATTGGEGVVLRGHEAAVNSAAFSPDGTRIVTASADKTARIFDAATGEEIATLVGHESFVQSAAFSGDGKRIVTASADQTARVFDAASGSTLAVLRGHEAVVTSAAFSADGSRIVTASADKTARIFDAATGREMAQLRGHDNIVNSAAFSADGKLIVTASADKTARIFDAALATMPAKALVAEACAHRLQSLATLTRDEMRLAGYGDETPLTDVCASSSLP